MFGGYQNEKIVLVADTREELENNKFMAFEKVEELADTYELYDGEYITTAEAAAKRAEAEKAAQIESLKKELDTLDLKAIRALRAIAAGEGTEADSSKLAEIEAQAAVVRQQLHSLEYGE